MIEHFVENKIEELFSKFHQLNISIHSMTDKFIVRQKQMVTEFIEKIILYEEKNLFTNRILQPIHQNYKISNKIDSQSLMIYQMREKIDCYFYFVTNNLKDLIPKILNVKFIQSFENDYLIFMIEQISQ